MNISNRFVALAAAVALTGTGVILDAQQQSNRAGDQQTRELYSRLDSGISTFRGSLDQAIDRTRLNGSRAETDINRSVNDLDQATERLRDRRGNRRATPEEVEGVLTHAATIDTFMSRNAFDGAVERDWRNVRGDLDELARVNNVTWSWADPGEARGDRRSNARLTGTYQLESTSGDDPTKMVEQATASVPSNQRQATRRRLMNRLEAPEMIAIEREGTNVTMASSRGRRVTFDADGQVHSEPGASGRTVDTRATLNGNQLTVTTTGNRGSDFAATFEPVDGGRNLRVTRSIHDDTLRQPVTVRSFYRKSSEDARWDIYSERGSERTSERGMGRPGSTAADFGVPDGTRLVATLEKALSTRDASAEERFTLTTRSPSEYEGAIIEGTVSSVNASGRISGRAEMALDFDRIRLRNGRTSEFSGLIESMRSANGEAISVDSAGTVEENSQTEKTVQRGAIGAALGAIIGAISGGGQGAAIGAAVGAGGGAGTVMIQGRDHLDLARGTEVIIISGPSQKQRTSTGRQP